MGVVKTWNGIARSSLKTWDGIAAASVKTINGFDATVSSGYTLLYNSFFAGGSTVYVCYSNTYYYAGQGYFNDSARTIGKVAFKVTATGTISGKTYYARIWTQSGDNLATNVATSDGVTGVNAWSASEVEFVFSTPYTTTGSTNYTITIDAGSADSSNYIQAYYVATASAPTPPPGNLAYQFWNTGMYPTESTANEIQIKIYTTP